MESLAVLLMCLYTLFMYLIYTSPAIESIHSLVLYAFLGCAVLSVLFRMKLKLNKYWIWCLCFVVLSFFSTFYAPNRQNSLSYLYTLIVLLGLVVAMSIILTGQKRMELFMKCLVFGAVILMIYLIATGQTNINTEAGERLGNELTGNANVFACLYMVAACSSVYFIMERPRLWQKTIYIAAFFLQMYALILSGGRKYPLIPLLAWFLLLLFKKDSRGKKHILAYSVGGIAVLVGLYFLMIRVPLFYETIGHRFESLVEYALGTSQTSDASTIERELMRQKAFALWLQAPLLGNGFDAFSQIGGFGVYCHCNYLELLCNQGIIGFACYYGFWGYLCVRIYRNKQNTLMRLFLGGVLIGLLIYDYGAISYNTPLTHFFALMASIYIDAPQDTFETFEQIRGKKKFRFVWK